MVKMNILLVLFAAANFVACLGSPVEYQRDGFETGRNANIQVSQNTSPEELKPSREHYQASRTNNQPTRQEYRRFGNDALSQSSQVDTSAANFNGNERKPSQNQNSEIQTTFQVRNQVSQFPAASEGTVQKSSFRSQDLATDTLFAYTPVSRIQTTLASQENLRSAAENAEDHMSVTSVYNQGVSQKGTPFVSMDRRPETQTGMYESSFGASFPRAQDQISQSEEAAFQNQNNFRSPMDDQRFQSQQTFYQNVARGDHRVNQQDQQVFNQRAVQDTQDQISNSQRSQEQVNQFPKPQQGERSPGPVSSFERDNFYNQGQMAFDSRRISAAAPVSQPLDHVSEEEKYFSSQAQFPRNQQSEKSQNRQMSGIKTNIHFEENKHSQTDNRKQSAESTHGDRQGLFRSTEQNQSILTVPKVQQTSSTVLVSGTKGTPAVPVMVYKTGSVASPHAVVLGRDLGVINKASVSQHLQTPFTQYTYTHPL